MISISKKTAFGILLALLTASINLTVNAQVKKQGFIRPGQEASFDVVVTPVRKMTPRKIGMLAGREVYEIDSPAKVSSMGKMMTVDPKGFVWYVESREDKAVRINPKTLEVSEYILPKGSAPYSIVSDSKGVLWITAHGIEMLMELHPEKELVLSHQPPSHGFLIHINVDKTDDTIYFCQPGANSIVQYRSNEGFKEYTIPTPNSGPGRLDIEKNKILWFPELYANKLGKLDLKTGKFEEWDLPIPNALPAYSRVDRKGIVWVSMPMVDKIGSFKDGKFLRLYDIPTKESIVSANVEDEDGNIWFTEGGWRGSAGGNKVGFLDPKTGKVEELALPTENAQPLGMVIDEEGTVWFEQSSGARIGFIRRGAKGAKAN
jgi:virginiamycin B lyase